MGRAIKLFNGHPQKFRSLMRTGMQTDRSWAQPGKDYLNIYSSIKHR